MGWLCGWVGLGGHTWATRVFQSSHSRRLLHNLTMSIAYGGAGTAWIRPSWHFCEHAKQCEAYKRKNGPISAVSLFMSICSVYGYDLPNFCQNGIIRPTPLSSCESCSSLNKRDQMQYECDQTQFNMIRRKLDTSFQLTYIKGHPEGCTTSRHPASERATSRHPTSRSPNTSARSQNPAAR